MTKREQRVIRAFINCVKRGEFTADYAITLLEDEARYGWLSETAKQAFYAGIEEDGETAGEEPEAPRDEEAGDA